MLFLGSMNMDLCISVLIFRGHHKNISFMNGRGLIIHTCRAVLQIEGGVFFRDLRMEGGRGSGGPASHTSSFQDLVPLQALIWL